MKKIVIKNLQNQITHLSKFATEQECLDWKTQVQATGAFGKPERWVSEDRLTAEGEDITQSTEMMVEPIMGREVKLYKFASQFTFEIIDTAAEDLAVKKLSDRSKKRAFGEALIDKISTMNDSKNLTVEQVDAFMSNVLISSLREHLWAGNIDTFITKLGASDVSAFFTSQEKTAVIAECQTFLTSLES